MTTRSAERGESLIELLIAVMIMGTAVVALLGAVGTAIRISDIHRKQAVAGVYLKAFADAITTKVAAMPSGYPLCPAATPTTYTAMYDDGTPLYVSVATTVRFWSATSFTATCAPDSGVQRVSLEVRSADGRAVERLDLVVRRPCRVGEPLCPP